MDYYSFSNIVKLINESKHLTKSGLAQIEAKLFKIIWTLKELNLNKFYYYFYILSILSIIII